MVSLWPWPLTSWSQNLISSFLCPTDQSCKFCEIQAVYDIMLTGFSIWSRMHVGTARTNNVSSTILMVAEAKTVWFKTSTKIMLQSEMKAICTAQQCNVHRMADKITMYTVQVIQMIWTRSDNVMTHKKCFNNRDHHFITVLNIATTYLVSTVTTCGAGCSLRCFVDWFNKPPAENPENTCCNYR